MSDDTRKKTGSSGTGRSSGGSASGKSSSGKGSSGGAGAKKNSSTGSRSSSSGGTQRSASSGAPKKTTTSSGGAAAKKSTSSGAVSRSTTGKKTASAGASKGTGASGSKKTGTSARTASGAAGTKSGTKRTAASTGSAKKRSSYDDIPYNPKRDAQDERDLHNSPDARRIQDERRRKKYNKNRRWYNLAFYAAIAVAVISVVIILSVTVLFNISDITVEKGNNIPYTDEEILAACGIVPGDNLFAIDAGQVAQDVTTALPYIEVCNVLRKLPSTLELDVHAAIPLGKVTTTDGVYIVLSASGRALEYADTYSGQPIAHINGMDVTFGGIGLPATLESSELLDVAAELVVGYSLYGLTLDSITFEASGAVSVSYDGRIKINMGVPTNLSQKIQVSASMIAEGKIAKNESGTLDMSIDERAVFSPDYLQNNG